MKSLRISLNILIALLLLLLSAACSPKEQPVTENKPAAENKQMTTEPQTAAKNKPDSQETSAVKKDSPVSTPGIENEAKPLPMHKNITVFQEGMKETKQGTLYESPQGYYLYTLPKFTASAEEPGVDVVLTSYDKRDTMRIELLSKDASVAKLIQDAKENLAALGEVNEQKDVSDPFFKQAKAYLFASDNKATRVIIIQEIAGRLFRFTFTVAHAETAEGITPKYWAMIKTIDLLK